MKKSMNTALGMLLALAVAIPASAAYIGIPDEHGAVLYAVHYPGADRADVTGVEIRFDPALGEPQALGVLAGSDFDAAAVEFSSRLLPVAPGEAFAEFAPGRGEGGSWVVARFGASSVNRGELGLKSHGIALAAGEGDHARGEQLFALESPTGGVADISRLRSELPLAIAPLAGGSGPDASSALARQGDGPATDSSGEADVLVGATLVRLRVPVDGTASAMRIVDLRGRVVTELQPTATGAREAVYEWDLNTANGGRASAGVYFGVVARGGEPHSTRFVVLR